MSNQDFRCYHKIIIYYIYIPNPKNLTYYSPEEQSSQYSQFSFP